MGYKITCDGPKCPNEQSVHDDELEIPFGWIKAEKSGESFGVKRIRHYCSYKCEHTHTYLLISGDNGK